MKSLKSALSARPGRIRASLLVLAASVLSLGATATAFGQAPALSEPGGQGGLYRPAPPVAADQAQIVFFRSASEAAVPSGAAHVYVDGELEGALMPEGYTRFCVAKGAHSVEAYVDDAPLYAGKANPKTVANVEGGKTYFVGVSEDGSGAPVPYGRADAERLLKNSREQNRIINRASAVVPCRYQAEPVAAAAPLSITINASVLFEFGHGDAESVTSEGREELRHVAEKIRSLPAGSVAGVTIAGYADPIGRDSYNLALSERRAQAVGAVLSDYGIAPGLIQTVGMGSAEPVVDCPAKGDRATLLACNAPNRRVEITVERTRRANES